MTVDELREMLAEHPGHWRVSVQVPDGAETMGGRAPVVDVYAWQEGRTWLTGTPDATPIVVVSS